MIKILKIILPTAFFVCIILVQLHFIKEQKAEQAHEEELTLLLEKGILVQEYNNKQVLFEIHKVGEARRKVMLIYETACGILEKQEDLYRKLLFWQEHHSPSVPDNFLNQLLEEYNNSLYHHYDGIKKKREYFYEESELEKLREKNSKEYEQLQPSLLVLAALNSKLNTISKEHIHYAFGQFTFCGWFDEFKPHVKHLPEQIKQGEDITCEIFLADYSTPGMDEESYFLQSRLVDNVFWEIQDKGGF